MFPEACIQQARDPEFVACLSSKGGRSLTRLTDGWEPKVETKAEVCRGFILGANVWNTNSSSECPEMRRYPHDSSPRNRFH